MRKPVRYRRYRRRRAIPRAFDLDDERDCDFGFPVDEKDETPPLK
jgi:hypothetical protein